MSSNPFNNPGAAANPFAPQQPQHHQHTNGVDHSQVGVAGELNQPQEAPVVFDANDPLLVSESLTQKEGDAFAQPAPPPDRKWRVILKNEGIKKQGTQDLVEETFPGVGTLRGVAIAEQKDKNGNRIGLYLRTLISITIQDPNGKYDGIHIYVPFRYIDTKPNRDGVSKIMTVLNLLRRPDGTPWVAKGEKLSHPALMERFLKALATEPEIGCESQWEWQCDGCNAEAKAKGQFAKSIQGMQKFPPSKTVRGEYDPEMACPVNRAHGYSKAGVIAARFVGLGEVGR